MYSQSSIITFSSEEKKILELLFLDHPHLPHGTGCDIDLSTVIVIVTGVPEILAQMFLYIKLLSTDKFPSKYLFTLSMFREKFKPFYAQNISVLRMSMHVNSFLSLSTLP